jgi:hypothetical protein
MVTQEEELIKLETIFSLEITKTGLNKDELFMCECGCNEEGNMRMVKLRN